MQTQKTQGRCFNIDKVVSKPRIHFYSRSERKSSCNSSPLRLYFFSPCLLMLLDSPVGSFVILRAKTTTQNNWKTWFPITRFLLYIFLCFFINIIFNLFGCNIFRVSLGINIVPVVSLDACFAPLLLCWSFVALWPFPDKIGEPHSQINKTKQLLNNKKITEIL